MVHYRYARAIHVGCDNGYYVAALDMANLMALTGVNGLQTKDCFSKKTLDLQQNIRCAFMCVSIAWVTTVADILHVLSVGTIL